MKILETIKKAIRAEQARKFEVVKAEYLRIYKMRERYSYGVNIPSFILVEQKMNSIMANNELDAQYKRIMEQNRRFKVAA